MQSVRDTSHVICFNP